MSMNRAADLPNLATDAPIWLALATVGVNAIVGALRGYNDVGRRWDIVGVTTFALLMGLGGGFIRDVLLGNLPAESLRSPWYLVTVLVAVVIVVALGDLILRAGIVVRLLDALALGLFAVTGTAYGLAFDLPAVSAVLLGTITAVGGGVLVSVLEGEPSGILQPGVPLALSAAAGAVVYAVVSQWNSPIASVAGIVVIIGMRYVTSSLGMSTRPVGARPPRDSTSPPAL